MIREEAIQLLKTDVPEWNRRQRSGESVCLDLRRADLSGANLSRANFSGADLSGAHLNGADLSNAELRVRLDNADLSNARLNNADLNGAHLNGADLSGADLSGANLSGANLRRADLSGANLRRADLRRANLIYADLRGADLSGANLSGATLSATNLSDANLSHANFSDAYLVGADLSGADLSDADLNNADLRHAYLAEAKLNKAGLGGADLRGAHVNTFTQLHGARVSKCTIDRHTLESLSDYGGLTKGDRMTMNIIDHVATLRASYSGFLQWIHLAALAVFLSPYVYFVGTTLVRNHFGLVSDGPQMTLRLALLRFIWNGGRNLHTPDLNLYAVSLFVFALLYNLLRGVLLWKTKTLELQQESSGLPAPFSLLGGWSVAYQAARWGFYGNLVVVALHTWHFLGTIITLPE